MMKKWSSLILGIASLLVLVPSLRAQAVYTASRTLRAQVGFGGLFQLPDYSTGTLKGISFWADLDVKKYIGVEAEVHMATLITPADFGESSYMIGPRLLYHRRKLTAYGKLLVGRATIVNQLYDLSSSYNAYEFGGGVDYRIARKFNIRVIDFELQKWPDFEPHTLSPVAATVGLSYIIF